jgi:predicted methyltransferase
MRKASTILAVLLVAMAAAAAADNYSKIVDAADRTADDKKDDAARKPAEVLTFLEVKPAMKVADIGAGGGYTTELLARAVGPKGVVYSQNTQGLIDKVVHDSWDKRLATPPNKNVVRVVREFDDPLPPEAKNLDLVVIAFIYHDTVWLGTDRDKMNKAIFAALKPGGVYVVLDHAGKAGTGSSEAKTLHRIEDKAVIDEVTKAGFKIGRRGDFLKNADDAHDKNVFDASIRGKTDRFAIAFVKPAK